MQPCVVHYPESPVSWFKVQNHFLGIVFGTQYLYVTVRGVPGSQYRPPAEGEKSTKTRMKPTASCPYGYFHFMIIRVLAFGSVRFLILIWVPTDISTIFGTVI